MQKRIGLLGMAAIVLIAGCGNQMVVGTWTADKQSGAASPIARATFAGDGTFTAEAEYGGGKTHAVSGTYKVEKGTLKLTTDGTTREYPVTVESCSMTMTHNGKSAKMMKMCATSCASACCKK